jgi:hypothetical protein
MTTLADALGGMAHPLAGALAEWRNLSEWQRFLLRKVAPEFARACEEFDEATHRRIDPP